MIEQTYRQIRSIEKLSAEVKTSMKLHSKRMPRDSIETFFMMSASEVEINTNRLSVDSSTQQPALKANKRPKMAIVSRESLQPAAETHPIDAAKTVAIETSRVESCFSARAVSKTMVHTTDAEAEKSSVSSFKQVTKKASQNENRRAQKSHDKKKISTDKVLQSISRENELSPKQHQPDTSSKRRSSRTTQLKAAETAEV